MRRRVAILVAGLGALTALGVLLVVSRGTVQPRTRVLGEQVQRVTERSDNLVSIDYRAAGGSAKASSERVISNPPPPDPLRFELLLGDPGPDGTVAVRADLTDQTGGPSRFAGGLDVSVSITRDGRPWQTLSLRRPEVTELAAQARVSVSGSVALDADGHYDLSGQVTVEYQHL